jgi:hypothetical protein
MQSVERARTHISRLMNISMPQTWSARAHLSHLMNNEHLKHASAACTRSNKKTLAPMSRMPRRFQTLPLPNNLLLQQLQPLRIALRIKLP